ncbi:unnamed protein product [Mytilus coruscus]|uniref:Reverse transcriptase domain-containing protein n=1 Tax=Mytilus coruscus TaxID=42192 RepID=A0A6J8E7J8_MYTCO|nr:unnamed protein product [Mytilus coruscus]
MTRRWEHLEGVSKKLIPVNDCKFGLLIGYDCARALTPREVKTGKGNEPYTQKTDLGWGIVGITDPTSAEDCSEPNFPIDQSLALQRFKHLRKRLQKDTRYRKGYFTGMNDLIAKGNAEKVDSVQSSGTENVWWKTDFHNIYNMDNSTAEFNDNFNSQVLSHKSSLEDRMVDPLYDENQELNTTITIDEISCNSGVRQGNNLSPTFFSIFINDLVQEVKDLDLGVSIGNSNLSIMLYADDIVLIER